MEGVNEFCDTKHKRAISSPDKKLASSEGSPIFCRGFFELK